MSCERIAKFHDDCLKLTTASTINNQKISNELQKLSKWLFKHQDEAVPESCKSKLLSTMQLYYKHAVRNPDATDAVTCTLDDFMKLPEGKLVNSKGKQSCLGWYGALTVDKNILVNECGVLVKKYMVADIVNGNNLTLMSVDPNSSEVIENLILTNSEILDEIKSGFDSEEGVSVEVRIRNETTEILRVLPYC
jgi:hypothetical protein